MTKSNPVTVREVIATFIDSESLRHAVEELDAAGFTNESIDMLASDKAVIEKLSDIYERVHKEPSDSQGPPVDFVLKDTVGESYRNMIGAIGWYGATLSGGVLLISAGIIGSPLLAALAAVPAVAGATAVIGNKLRQSEAEHLEEQIDQGNILLFVRVDDREKEKSAAKILKGYSDRPLTIVDVPNAA